MNEYPLFLSATVIESILSGKKTQTRVPVHPQPSVYVPIENNHLPKHPKGYLDSYCSEPKTDKNPRGMSDRWCWWSPDNRQGPDWIKCPFGVPGDRLWIKETWRAPVEFDSMGTDQIKEKCLSAGYQGFWCPVEYFDSKRDGWPTHPILAPGRLRPAATMPRELARLVLEISQIEIQRLQEITKEQLTKEGLGEYSEEEARVEFQNQWKDCYNRKAPWKNDPWVWVLSFQKVRT